jgi:hypothetical protein
VAIVKETFRRDFATNHSEKKLTLTRETNHSLKDLSFLLEGTCTYKC